MWRSEPSLAVLTQPHPKPKPKPNHVLYAQLGPLFVLTISTTLADANTFITTAAICPKTMPRQCTEIVSLTIRPILSSPTILCYQDSIGWAYHSCAAVARQQFCYQSCKWSSVFDIISSSTSLCHRRSSSAVFPWLEDGRVAEVSVCENDVT
ncbi:hypothetical protein BDZ97DRAFT_1237951 [Flammula alnicola]|nr:hypothetical protein BDZ97DRAFT_1237951 [Flammula alnicola]